MAAVPELLAHQEWLGFVQPVGLVVTAPALVKHQAFVNRDIVREQQCLQDLTEEQKLETARGPAPRAVLASFPRFCTAFLGWEPSDLAGADGAPLPEEFEIALPEYGDRLAASFAVFDPDAAPDAPLAERTLLLIQQLAVGQDFDAPATGSERGWHASPQARFERLLRETGVPQGLLGNGTALRLVYAPRGESSGHVTFEFDALLQVAGRPLVSALHMLLCAERLFSLPTPQRLPSLLRESRRYQNEVSTQLAEQVLQALLELLRGFRAADAATRGQLLADVLAAQPNEIYGGLLTTLMRLVFLLYAEDRGLLPQDPVYVQHYAVAGLFEKLRDDAGRHPDTMDQRYGAWARLLALFRLIHEGGAHAGLRLPARRGRLFDPDAYPFLEGRARGSAWREDGLVTPPRVADGVLLRVLEKLLMLDGERLSYRALDVEQIGSVYEAMMGFELGVAQAASIAVRPDHVVVNLEALFAEKPAARAKRLADEAACKLTGPAAASLRSAKTTEDLVATLERRLSPHTPSVLPKGALYLQPTEERRRSGAHYTPRSLTEPIVRTTLEPILEALGPEPRADEILALRVCDPAMGSGAFLVEASRFLGDAVVRAWERHGDTPEIPPDEDPHLFARRLVAQRCLYGVDKNPFAVDLAKLSLWLGTLAKDHPFTFLDHAFRCGDSLVGLSREQIASFHWAPEKQIGSLQQLLLRRMTAAEKLRGQIQALAGSDDTAQKAKLLAESDALVEHLRLVGDLALAAFFGEAKPRARETLRKQLETRVELWLGGKGDAAALAASRAALHDGPQPIRPFHWQIEFPEVFSRANPGFDAFVGNPPFAGKNTTIASHRAGYLPWLQTLHPESHGNADLVAHFYRRAFDLLRPGGTFGLIATNTIAQGDTRETGLRWICTHGGRLYAVRRRVKWPGVAAVVVSVVHAAKGDGPDRRHIDGRPVERITAFLFHAGGHESPARLRANAGKSFQGSIVLGMGFTFDDANDDATPLAEMERLIAKDPRNRERIFPYIGGEELNGSPTHAHRRYVINFGEMSEQEARRWPDLMAIVEAKVKPERMQLGDNADARRRKANWWLWGRYTPALFTAIEGLERVLAISQTSNTGAFAFLPTHMVYSHKLVVFPLEPYSFFASVQSRMHELWFRFFGSTMKDDSVYTPSDCFETFPFPEGWQQKAALEDAGRVYYQTRADLMVRSDEGLTSTYNRFHDPNEQSAEILHLRALHDAMDRAVLDAYGWTDLHPECKFLLDYDDEAAEEASPGRRRRPWRYRWPDELRDEVLARLLALNQQRAAAEQIGGASAPRKPERSAPRGATRRKRAASKSLGPLFGDADE